MKKDDIVKEILKVKQDIDLRDINFCIIPVTGEKNLYILLKASKTTIEHFKNHMIDKMNINFQNIIEWCKNHDTKCSIISKSPPNIAQKIQIKRTNRILLEKGVYFNENTYDIFILLQDEKMLNDFSTNMLKKILKFLNTNEGEF